MYTVAFQKIDEIRADLEQASYQIWSIPEASGEEYTATEVCTKLLEKYGFAVEKNYLGIPTSIRAEFGEGSPAIGLLGEYDALPGLAQESVPYKKPKDQENGHGCGHNLIGIAAIGSLIALREAMIKFGIKGKVVFYGCPEEELCKMKGIMATRGAFDELDAAFAWHPGNFNRSPLNSCTGYNSTFFHFSGKTAHAANNPESGRSALDAVELMNIGANYLREHITTDARIHYVITDGGVRPNIVPDHACVWYVDRALNIKDMLDIEKRLGDIAQGAALMTGTTVTVKRGGGCYPTLLNIGLAKLIDRCMREIPLEPWTQEELDYAAKVNEADPDSWQHYLEIAGIEEKISLCDRVVEMDPKPEYGSTDVGDVSYIVPAVFYKTASYAIGAPGHSWQIASCVGTSIGWKGMILGAKVTTMAALRLLTEPELLKSIRDEFNQKTKGFVYKAFEVD